MQLIPVFIMVIIFLVSMFAYVPILFIKQIRQMKLNKPKKQKIYPKSNYEKPKANYPGERVQINVKFVPNEVVAKYFSEQAA